MATPVGRFGCDGNRSAVDRNASPRARVWVWASKSLSFSSPCIHCRSSSSSSSPRSDSIDVCVRTNDSLGSLERRTWVATALTQTHTHTHWQLLQRNSDVGRCQNQCLGNEPTSAQTNVAIRVLFESGRPRPPCSKIVGGRYPIIASSFFFEICLFFVVS